MEIRPVMGTGSQDQDKSLFFSFWQQWSEITKPSDFNWVNFTLVKIEFEYDDVTGRVVFDAGLIGFCANVTYIFDHSFNKSCKKTLDEFFGEQ